MKGSEIIQVRERLEQDLRRKDEKKEKRSRSDCIEWRFSNAASMAADPKLKSESFICI